MMNPSLYRVIAIVGIALLPLRVIAAQTAAAQPQAEINRLTRQLDSVRIELAKYKARDGEIRLLIADLYAKVAQANARPSTSLASAARTLEVAGDLVIPDGRLCIGGPCGAGNEQIQILARRDAEVLFLSNMGGRDSQGGPTHASMISLAGDGGFRMIHNYRHLPTGGLWQEPDKPRTIWGFDSQGTPSLSQDYDGVFDRSQSFVLQFDRNNRRIFLASMKAGWTWGFRTSTVTNQFDRQWLVPVSDPPAAPSQ